MSNAILRPFLELCFGLDIRDDNLLEMQNITTVSWSLLRRIPIVVRAIIQKTKKQHQSYSIYNPQCTRIKCRKQLVIFIYYLKMTNYFL